MRGFSAALPVAAGAAPLDGRLRNAIQAAAPFETPLQNFVVRPALLHTLNQIAVMHPQKITTNTVCGFGRTEVFLIIFVQVAAQMQSNLVQHPREIHHAARHFFRTLWIGSHRQTNRIILGPRNIGETTNREPLGKSSSDRTRPIDLYFL